MGCDGMIWGAKLTLVNIGVYLRYNPASLGHNVPQAKLALNSLYNKNESLLAFLLYKCLALHINDPRSIGV